MDPIESDMNTRNDKEKTFMWVMTAENAAEFYDRCLRTESLSKAERINILNQMASEGKISHAISSSQKPEDLLTDLSKVAKILYVKGDNK